MKAYSYVCSENTDWVIILIFYIKSNFVISGPILKIKTVLEMLFHYAFESLTTLLKSTDSEENESWTQARYVT